MKMNLKAILAAVLMLVACTRVEALPNRPTPTPSADARGATDPTFRIQPADSTGVVEIDDAVWAVMKLNGVRGAALAIVNGTRLVYARGYTWAPPDYPEVATDDVLPAGERFENLRGDCDLSVDLGRPEKRQFHARYHHAIGPAFKDTRGQATAGSEFRQDHDPTVAGYECRG